MAARLTLWGVRGSTTNTSPNVKEFGGDTACFQLEVPGRHIIFDAGSGIIELGQKLVASNQSQKIVLDIILSHFHYDHILGLPFFAPLFDPRFQIRILAADSVDGTGVDAVLDQIFSPPFCPITRDMFRAKVTTQVLIASASLQVASELKVTAAALPHPGGNCGFRVDIDDKCLVYTGDFEPSSNSDEAQLLRLLDNADLALLDCTYTPQNYKQFHGYGHPHWGMVGALANKAGVTNWIGIHHQHLASDKTLSAVEEEIAIEFPNGKLARQGMIFEL
ncbi:MAG: MBL fold metallo-hydrolase [Hyphomicrobiales bacterium]